MGEPRARPPHLACLSSTNTDLCPAALGWASLLPCPEPQAALVPWPATAVPSRRAASGKRLRTPSSVWLGSPRIVGGEGALQLLQPALPLLPPLCPACPLPSSSASSGPLHPPAFPPPWGPPMFVPKRGLPLPSAQSSFGPLPPRRQRRGRPGVWSLTGVFPARTAGRGPAPSQPSPSPLDLRLPLPSLDRPRVDLPPFRRLSGTLPTAAPRGQQGLLPALRHLCSSPAFVPGPWPCSQPPGSVPPSWPGCSPPPAIPLPGLLLIQMPDPILGQG